MRIIDPHVHVWKNDPRFPWAPETTNPPEEDATAETLLALMAANGVEKTVLVQVIHYRWDNRYAADAMKRYPDKFMGVCRIQPRRPRRTRPSQPLDGGRRISWCPSESFCRTRWRLVCRTVDATHLSSR